MSEEEGLFDLPPFLFPFEKDFRHADQGFGRSPKSEVIHLKMQLHAEKKDDLDLGENDANTTLQQECQER